LCDFFDLLSISFIGEDMGQPAAKQGDQIITVDMHIVLVPTPPGAPVPTPLPHPFNGILNDGLSNNVRVMGRPAAVQGSSATNTPSHIPTPPGTSFTVPPTNKGIIMKGSSTVFINKKPAARIGDTVQTCQDPAPNLSGQIVPSGPCTVVIGG
jgi:uncharacterized Zn-binding protein involved in type VI secretion